MQQESCFWRRSLLEQVDLDKFRTLKLAGDYYLWFSFAQKSQIYRVDAMLGCFRQRLGQQSEKWRNILKSYNYALNWNL